MLFHPLIILEHERVTARPVTIELHDGRLQLVDRLKNISRPHSPPSVKYHSISVFRCTYSLANQPCFLSSASLLVESLPGSAAKKTTVIFREVPSNAQFQWRSCVAPNDAHCQVGQPMLKRVANKRGKSRRRVKQHLKRRSFGASSLAYNHHPVLTLKKSRSNPCSHVVRESFQRSRPRN